MKWSIALRVCKREKKKAQERYDSDNVTVKHDSAQAINAWDELVGQLYKPNGIKVSQFLKAKQTALRIIRLISNPGYKRTMRTKIENIKLD